MNQPSPLQKIAGVIITVSVLVFILANYHHKQLSDQPTTDQSLTKGLNYLDHSNKVSPLQWLLMDYLARKFDLDSKFLAANRQFQPPTEPQATVEYQVYKRIAFPDQLVDTLPPSDNDPTNRMVVAALHCDHIPLPADFAQLLQSNADAGDYQLTHVAFSLERMNENGCPLPEDQDQKLRQQLKTGLLSIIQNSQTIPDLRYEALAMLMHIGFRNEVKQPWIDQVVREQSDDGGWQDRADSPSNDHATVLAIWAILEYSRPDAPPEPMLHHPAPSVALASVTRLRPVLAL